MSQVDLLNKLLPSIPELNEILTKIRGKHNIPPVLPEHEQLIESLSQERTLEEWEAIRQEIENELGEWFLSSSALSKLVGLFNDAQEKTGEIKSFLVDERLNVPEDVADRFIDGLVKNAVSGLEALNIFFTKGSEKLLDYLITGRPLEVPAVWFNLVTAASIPPDGEKYVVAVAHQFSDPDEITEEFRARIIETFGEKPNVKKEHLDTAEYLAMKNTGKKLEDIVDLYLERYPNEIPYARGTSKYNAARKRLKDTLRQRLYRLQQDVNQIVDGDKK